MKPNQIPLSIKLWLILLGLWAGTTATIVLTCLWITGIDFALYTLITYFLAVLGLWYALGKKYGKALTEWGILEPKKEKNKQ